MPVEYKRTEDPDIFLELRTQITQLSMTQLETQLAELNAQIQNAKQDVTIPGNATDDQREAIEFFNTEQREFIRHVVEERDKLKALIDTLNALPKTEKI